MDAALAAINSGISDNNDTELAEPESTDAENELDAVAETAMEDAPDAPQEQEEEDEDVMATAAVDE